MSDSVDERVAKISEAEERLRQGLAARNMDGPHRFPDGMFGAGLFGGGRDKFAVCLVCGAMVLLNDHAQNEDGSAYERSATTHANWHEAQR